MVDGCTLTLTPPRTSSLTAAGVSGVLRSQWFLSSLLMPILPIIYRSFSFFCGA